MATLTITKDTPRKERTIGTVKVQVPQPFAAGQTLDEGLARILNQTLAENFSNNLRKKIEGFIPANSPKGTKARLASSTEAQTLVDTYATTYDPSAVRTAGAGTARLSPVEREMRVIARELVNGLLTEQNIKRSQLPKEGDGSYTSLVEQVVNEHTDALRAKAEAIVATREQQAKTGGIKLAGLKLPSAAKPAA